MAYLNGKKILTRHNESGVTSIDGAYGAFALGGGLERDGQTITGQAILNVAEGKTKSYTISYANNSAFNSQNASLSGITSFIDISGNTIQTSTLKNGDIILIVETDVPDRWFSISDSKFYKMETSKVDLTSYATKSELNALPSLPSVNYMTRLSSASVTLYNASGSFGTAQIDYAYDSTKKVLAFSGRVHFSITNRNSDGPGFIITFPNSINFATTGLAGNISVLTALQVSGGFENSGVSSVRDAFININAAHKLKIGMSETYANVGTGNFKIDIPLTYIKCE